MCRQAIWLDRGTVRAAGPTDAVLGAYLDAVDDVGEERGDAYVSAECVEVLDRHGRPTATLAGDEPFTVRVAGNALRDLVEPVFVVTIRGDHGPLFAGNMHIDGNWPAALPRGPFTVECAFDRPSLRAGHYRVELKVKQNVRTNYYEPRIKAQFPRAWRALERGKPGPWRGQCAIRHHWRPLTCRTTTTPTSCATASGSRATRSSRRFPTCAI